MPCTSGSFSIGLRDSKDYICLQMLPWFLVSSAAKCRNQKIDFSCQAREEGLNVSSVLINGEQTTCLPSTGIKDQRAELIRAISNAQCMSQNPQFQWGVVCINAKLGRRLLSRNDIEVYPNIRLALSTWQRELVNHLGICRSSLLRGI